MGVCTAQNCEERNLKESGYQCEWRYNSCAPACPVTCQHPEPLACPVPCVEGCHAHCPPGEALAPSGDGVEGGLVLRKVPPRPASSQPRPRALLPSPITLGPVSMSFYQSQASWDFCQTELPCDASGGPLMGLSSGAALSDRTFCNARNVQLRHGLVMSKELNVQFY